MKGNDSLNARFVRIPSPGTPSARLWGGEPTVRILATAVLAALVSVACTSGGRPATSVPVAIPSVPSTPAVTPSASPSPSASGTASVTSVEEAVAAVVEADPRFLGYGPQDRDLIGQTNFYLASRVGSSFELTFVAGSGDCPAGCIEHEFAKFRVTEDGTVTLLCEWSEGGEAPQGTPC